MARDNRKSNMRSSVLDDVELKETVVKIKPVSKVTKGGRDRRFNALVVVGDGKGRVGVGMGKAREVAEAIRKGTQIAQRNIKRVPVGTSIPHEVLGKCGAAKVFMRPASPGTGLIAGSAVRSVLEAAGVQNVLTKSMGSTNAHNVAVATVEALTSLRTYREVRTSRRLDVTTAAPSAGQREGAKS
jgi:small subunit ribosomal protein S5